MADTDKLKNDAERMKGQAKEHIGDATDNGSLEADGIGDQVKANLSQTGDDIKDALSGDDHNDADVDVDDDKV